MEYNSQLYLTRADLWARFATGALVDGRCLPEEAASCADSMLREFMKRFKWVEAQGYWEGIEGKVCDPDAA